MFQESPTFFYQHFPMRQVGLRNLSHPCSSSLRTLLRGTFFFCSSIHGSDVARPRSFGDCAHAGQRQGCRSECFTRRTLRSHPPVARSPLVPPALVITGGTGGK